LAINLNLAFFDSQRESGKGFPGRSRQSGTRPDAKLGAMSWAQDAFTVYDKLGFDATAQHSRAIMATGIFDRKIFSIQVKNSDGEISNINEVRFAWAELLYTDHINPVKRHITIRKY
jgi:hypothetical protein